MYFQNPMNQEFIGVLVLGDRQLSLNFKIKGNVNTLAVMTAWNFEPYNLSGNTNLTFNYTVDAGKTWVPFTVDVSTVAADVSAARAFEVAEALNNDPTFSTLFNAYTTQDKSDNPVNWLLIQTQNPFRQRGAWKTYISNGSAESILRFNKKAPIGQLPSYFSRHTIANTNVYPDSTGMLIQLDPTSVTDEQIIIEANDSFLGSGTIHSSSTTVTGTSTHFTTEASEGAYIGNLTKGFFQIASIGSDTSLTLATTPGSPFSVGSTYYVTTVDADWQLLGGRSGLFMFTSNTVDGSDRVTQSLWYGAGAGVGDLARQTIYTYSGSNTTPDQIAEVPYVLQEGDLISP